MRDAVFLRLLAYEDKATALDTVVSSLYISAEQNSDVYVVNPSSFQQVPGSPFAYWVSEHVRRLFSKLPTFDDEAQGRATRCGLGTLDDFRFLRLRWEVSEDIIGVNWMPYYHGGVYSPVYDEFPLVVLWKDDGAEIKSFVEQKVGSASRKVQGADHYFMPGFVFPRRTKAFSPKVMPAGGIYSTGGQAGFLPLSDLEWGIALLSSSICTYLISLSQGRTGSGPQYEVGLVKRLPWPTVDSESKKRLAALTHKTYEAKRFIASTDENSPFFKSPSISQVSGDSLSERYHAWVEKVSGIEHRLTTYQSEIDEIAFHLYDIEETDRATVEALSNVGSNGIAPDANECVAQHLSFIVGATMGRWDIRYAAGECDLPELPDPLASLPICPPCMLTGDDGLPLTATPPDYPILINWNGLLVDDPDHPDDVVRRVRDVLELLWGKQAEAIEHEACEILGVGELRDYFRKPGGGGFWDDHVKRYSKSRRKAPIYWLLQSEKKNYALWLYYHRLDKDMLFKALVNYVEPKLRLEEGRLEGLRAQRAALGTSGREAKQVERELDRQESLLAELHDFHDKLRRAAELHLEPDLNDGVVLNIAPLWELVPWKEAKKYWEALLAGRYEWSSVGKQLREKELVSDK